MDNKLIEIKDNLFTKIKKIFKNLFIKKEEVVRQEEVVTEEESFDNYLEFQNTDLLIVEDEYLYEDDDLEECIEIKSKEEFFELYEKVKKGEADLSKISTIDLIRMQEIMQNEISLISNN